MAVSERRKAEYYNRLKSENLVTQIQSIATISVSSLLAFKGEKSQILRWPCSMRLCVWVLPTSLWKYSTYFQETKYEHNSLTNTPTS
jgi:hypothetical protein